MAEGFEVTIVRDRLEPSTVYDGTRQPSSGIRVPTVLAVHCLACGAKFNASASATSGRPGTFHLLLFGSALITCSKCGQSATHPVG